MIGRLASLAALALAGCSVLNASDICEVEAEETQVNVAGDGVEHIGHPDSAVALADGRVLVAFGSVPEDVSSGEIRIAFVPTSNMCDTGEREYVISDAYPWAPGRLNHRPVLAPVAFSVPGAGDVVAAVGWSIGTIDEQDANIAIKYVNSAGCPVGDELEFLTTVPLPLSRISLAWSEPRQALLGVFWDGVQVWATWFRDFGGSADSWVLSGDESVAGGPVVSLGPDGSGIVAWVSDRFVDFDVQYDYRAVLIDADGRPREAVLAGGEAAPFTIRSGMFLPVEGSGPLSLAAAASAEHHAVLFDAADVADGTSHVWFRELDAADGNPLSWEDSPDGEASRIDLGDEQPNLSPAARYLPDGSLLTLWESVTGDGTVGRLLDLNGQSRFNAVSCDDGVFRVGARGGQLPGPSSTALSAGDLWVFHAADPTTDPIATGVMAWTLPLSRLWSGESQ